MAVRVRVCAQLVYNGIKLKVYVLVMPPKVMAQVYMMQDMGLIYMVQAMELRDMVLDMRQPDMVWAMGQPGMEHLDMLQQDMAQLVTVAMVQDIKQHPSLLHHPSLHQQHQSSLLHL